MFQFYGKQTLKNQNCDDLGRVEDRLEQILYRAMAMF